MSQDKIESRRAFMKKFGKLAGAAAIAAAFMATGSNYAEAKPSEDSPATGCGGGGGGYGSDCTGACFGNCSGKCDLGCERTCKGRCEGSCYYNTCMAECANYCKRSASR